MWINCKHTLFSLSVIWGITVMWDFRMDTWGEKDFCLFWEWAQEYLGRSGQSGPFPTYGGRGQKLIGEHTNFGTVFQKVQLMFYYGVSHWSVVGGKWWNRSLECWHYTCISMGLAFGVVRPHRGGIGTMLWRYLSFNDYIIKKKKS